MRTDKIIEMYFLEYPERFLDNSVKAYRTALNQFDDCLNGKSLAKITSDDILNYFANHEEWSDATKRLKKSIIEDFLKFASDNDYIPKMPIIDIKLAKSSPNITPRIKPRDLFHIEDTAKDIIRDRLVIQLLHRTGLRVSEICNIMITDIDLLKRTIFVPRIKGNRQQYAYFTAECAALMHQYLLTRVVEPGSAILFSNSMPLRDDNPYLLISLRKGHKKKQLTRQAINEILNKYVMSVPKRAVFPQLTFG
jgi:site-specific recombinase XerD